MRCTNCGKLVKKSYKFCPNCGYQLNTSHSHDLIVIGNGFDMFLGLFSSFKQFFGISVSNGTYNKLNSIIQQFLGYANNLDENYVINGDHGKKIKVTPTLLMEYIDVQIMRKLQVSEDYRFRYSSFNLDKSEINQLNDYVNDFSRDIKHIYSKITDDVNINFWAIYLILRKHTDDSQWSSVESEIYNFLTYKNIDCRSIIGDLFGITKISGFSYNKRTVHENNNPLKSFDIYLIIYLILKHIRTNKNQYLNLCNNLLKNNMNYHRLYLYMCKFFNTELSKFEYDLDGYLYRMCFNEYYKNYGFNYSDISKQLLACISSSNEFSLINFNYTNPYTKHNLNTSVIKSNEKNQNLINIRRNIHGHLIPKTDYKINKGYYSRQAPVIGISDEGWYN